MKTKLKHVLIYLIIISVMATGISFSRFSTTLTNSGAESTTPPDIQFSTFVIDHDAGWVSLKDLVPGDTKTIGIEVKNWKESGEIIKISDYNQSFNFELETTGNLPLVFSLRENGGGVGFVRLDSYHYVSDSREFTAGVQGTQHFTLEMTWPTWPAEIKAEQYRHEIDHLELRIKAVQL